MRTFQLALTLALTLGSGTRLVGKLDGRKLPDVEFNVVIVALWEDVEEQKKRNKGPHSPIYMLFAGWEVRIGKNLFFTIRTDPKPANNYSFFFQRNIGLQAGLFT